MTWLINFFRRLFGFGDAPKATAAAPTAVTPAAGLTAADYSASFFMTRLGSIVVKPYTLPAGARGYGPGGSYSAFAFDPSIFDRTTERMVYGANQYVDVRTLTRHNADGSTEPVDAQAMRGWLYALSLDPASVPDDITGLGKTFVNAPRALWRDTVYTGPGSF